MSFMAIFQRFALFFLISILGYLPQVAHAFTGNGIYHSALNISDSKFQLTSGTISPQSLGGNFFSDVAFNSISAPEIPAFSYNKADFKLSEFMTAEQDTVPDPRKVMRRSVVLPGWGQYTNRQFWKIPIVYGLMGGLSYYAYYAHTRYSGYRAAFYNADPANTDFRFGATPAWVDPNAPPQFYRTSRDFFRNRRDFLIVTVVFAYVLNFVDAYVYAHMRDFDVSDDLSSRITITPEPVLAEKVYPGVRFNIRF